MALNTISHARLKNLGTLSSATFSFQPTTKKAVPATWQKLPWHFLLELGGERWDKKNPTKNDSAGRKFRRFVENAKKAEYAVSSLSTNAHAPAGDTIEFYFGKKGLVYARATDRFTEAYRKSHHWGLGNNISFRLPATQIDTLPDNCPVTSQTTVR